MPQSQSIVLNSTALREFSGKYSQAADAWVNVANQLQLILDQFDAEASSQTVNKKPMPVTNDTRQILFNHLAGVAQACRDYAETIVEDSQGIAYLADAFDENEGITIAALEATTSPTMNMQNPFTRR